MNRSVLIVNMSIKKNNSVLLLLVSMLVTIACNPEFNDDLQNDNGGNAILAGSKWILTNWDYSLGEEYIGLHDETYNFFFYTSTEGLCYYGKKDYYSDQGTSSHRVVSYFTYSINGNEISLEYITDPYIRKYYLEVENDVLRAGELEFSKGTITSTDKKWLNTIHGTTGKCSWYSDLCGSLWIYGNGAMADYSSYNATPWAINGRTPNYVVINNGVTEIGSNAFANASLVDIDLPDKSLERIGNAAFKGSLIQNDIWFCDNVTIIEDEAFAGCTKLKHISIPNTIIEIGEYAFSGTNLNVLYLDFKRDLKSIGDFAFEGGKASSITFEEGVKTIGKGAFLGDYCGISKELILPNSLISIGSTAFEGPINKIVLGTGIQSLGDKAFISSVKTGEMYINLSTPPSVGENIIVDRTNWQSVESRWTLYVPKGCKSAYADKSPWNKFKSIIEMSY